MLKITCSKKCKIFHAFGDFGVGDPGPEQVPTSNSNRRDHEAEPDSERLFLAQKTVNGWYRYDESSQ